MTILWRHAGRNFGCLPAGMAMNLRDKYEKAFDNSMLRVLMVLHWLQYHRSRSEIARLSFDAVLQNQDIGQVPDSYVAELKVQIDGREFKRRFDKDSEHSGTGVCGELEREDLTGDGKEEIIVKLSVVGSTYGATIVYIMEVSEEGLTEILRVDGDNLKEYEENLIDCTGATANDGRLILNVSDMDGEEGCLTLWWQKGQWVSEKISVPEAIDESSVAVNNESGAMETESQNVSDLDEAIYEDSCGPLEKIDGIYQYSGEITGYDESLISEGGDWTEGYYVLTEGEFYVDDETKVIIETEDDYGFPAEGKTAAEWLDDFYARKEYWMIVNIKVKGNHIEEIQGIYSFD